MVDTDKFASLSNEELFDEWDEERCEGSYIGKFRNRADLAEDVVDGAGILRDVPDDVARYFDYEAYGQDLELRGDVREYNDHYFWTNY